AETTVFQNLGFCFVGDGFIRPGLFGFINFNYNGSIE
ncbi:unnamed protein product, partial [marine sediment metagenome]